MKKRLIALLCLISLMIIVIGCSKKPSKEGVKVGNKAESIIGKYTEQTMEEPKLESNEHKLAIIKNEEGKLEYYTQIGDVFAEKIFCYTKSETGYEKKEVTWAKEALASGGIEKLFLGEDGHYYLLLAMYKDMEEQSSLVTVNYTLFQSTDDLLSCKNVTPTLWEELDGEVAGISGATINNTQVLKEGLLIYQVNLDPTINLYSLKEQKVIELEQNQVTDYEYLVTDNTVYYISNNLEVVEFDYSSRKENRLSVDNVSQDAKLQINEEGTIFLLDASGIRRCEKTGSLWEIITDNSAYSMSNSSYSPVEFLHMQGEYDSFVIYYESIIDSKPSFLAEYTFGEIVKEENKELTIYSLWENATMREAISDYKKEHKDVNIHYEVAFSENSSATLSDQIRALNTEILAGNGADIFVLDGLPMESYIQKGVLMDMGDVLNPFIESEQLLSSISDDYTQDGKIYGMPMRFYMPFYATTEDIKEQTKSIAALSELASKSERNLFKTLSYEELLSSLLYIYSDEYMQEDGSIDLKAMTDFLQRVKGISDQIESSKMPTFDPLYIGGNSVTTPSYLHEFIIGNEFEIINYDIYATIGCAADAYDFDRIVACTNHVGGYYFSVKDLYISNGIVGINKETKEADIAKDFVKELYEESFQSVDFNDGFPVNATSLKTWMTKEPDPNLMSGFSTQENGKQIMIIFYEMDVEKKKEFYDMLLSLDTPITNNSTVIDMILEEAVGYLAGEKELEQTAQDITNKVNLYLNE